MNTGGDAARWCAAGASVRGASHVREGLPNQDALALWPTEPGPVAVAAVADGHGGRRHFRSADGARLAVETAAAVLREMAAAFDGADASQRAQLAGTEVPQRLVERWRVSVQADLGSRPITDVEWQALADAEGTEALASVQADPVLAYGATLLAALVTPRCMALFQLGDGDVLAVAGDGSTHRPVPSDERLGGNLTTSICRPGAAADVRSIAMDTAGQPPALLLLSTDGYANSFRTDADFLKVGFDYLALLREHGLGALEPRLPALLEEASTQGSGDDITLALLYRPAVDAAGDPAVASTEPALTAPPPARPPWLGHPWAATALLIVLLLAAGWWWRADLRQAFAGPRAAATPAPAASDSVRDPGLAGPWPAASADSAPAESLALASGPLALLDAQARPLAHGLEVTARLQGLSPTRKGCTARAEVFAGDDHALGDQTQKIVPTAEAAVPLRVLVPYSATGRHFKAAGKGKDVAATRFVLQVSCGGHVLVGTEPLMVSP